MMQLLPTYEVIIDPDGLRRQIYRVPAPRLEGFIAVLVFNNVQDFRVMGQDYVPDDGIPATAVAVD